MMEVLLNQGNLLNVLIKILLLLRQRIHSIMKANQISTFTAAVIETIQQATKPAYRLVTLRRTPILSFWIAQLKIIRNQLTALKIKLKNNSETHKFLSEKYTKLSTFYKHSLLKAKYKVL